MYYIPRGGNRGGADQFSWSDVKSDKDREYYLGHSLKAPVGRWQDGRDLEWFSKSRESGEDSMATERKAVKQAEKEAMMAALGQKVVKSQPSVMPTKQLNTTQVVPSLKSTTTKDVQKKSRSHDRKKSKKHKKHKKSEMKKMKSRKQKHHHRRSSSESSTDSSSELNSSESEEKMPRHKRHRHSSSDADKLLKRRKRESPEDVRRSKYDDDTDGKHRKWGDLQDKKTGRPTEYPDKHSNREKWTTRDADRSSSKRRKAIHDDKQRDESVHKWSRTESYKAPR